MPQLNLLAGTAVLLPDESELQQRFRSFNEMFFKSKLPEVDIHWSTRMRIAGTCHRHRGLITLSRPYHERFPQDVDDTLKHEMIHLRYHGHGIAFRREAQRVGASVHCREYEGIHPRAKLLYACPSCWREYHRMKPGELYCGRCSRGRLLPEFRLVLKRRLGSPDAPRPENRVSAKSAPALRPERASRKRAAAFGLLSLFE